MKQFFVLGVVVAALSRWPGLLPRNFSAFYALAFCAGVFFPRNMKWWLPLGTLVGTDLALNLYYLFVLGINAFKITQLVNYAAFVGILWFGTRQVLSSESHRGMVLAVGVLRALRRQVSLLDRQAMRDSLGLSEKMEFRAVLRRVLVAMLAVESVGAVLLWLHWRSTLGDETAAFYGLFHAISAFCNAGFALFDPAQFPSSVPSPITSAARLPPSHRQAIWPPTPFMESR